MSEPIELICDKCGDHIEDGDKFYDNKQNKEIRCAVCVEGDPNCFELPWKEERH